MFSIRKLIQAHAVFLILDLMTLPCQATEDTSCQVNDSEKNYVSIWTGRCLVGKADGFGSYSIYQKSASGARGPLVSESVMTVVDGQPAGMYWNCETPQSAIAGTLENVTGLRNCSFSSQFSTTSSYLLERETGRWIISDWVWRPLSPETRVMPGAIERELAKFDENAKRSMPTSLMRLETETSELSDLVKDGRLTFLIGAALPNMRTQRVAVVITSRAAAEIERFAKMRAELVAVSEGGRKIKERFRNSLKEERDSFITVSDPRYVVAGLVAGLRPHVREVIAADDFSVLDDGRSDYIVLLDWGFSGNFGLTPKQYSEIPSCKEEDKNKKKCYVLFEPSFSLMLLDRQLQVIRTGRPGYVHSLVYYFDQGASYDWLFDTLIEPVDELINVDQGVIRKQVEKLVNPTAASN